MKILIIVANPKTDSFSFAMANKYKELTLAKKHEVEMIDLYRSVLLSILLALSILLLSCEGGSSLLDLKGIDAEFIEDISYDKYSDTKFDIWLPKSETPTGLLIFIHGGGFTSGDKSIVRKNGQWDFPEEIRTLLSNGIAVASINYRLLMKTGEDEGVIKCLNDSKRALQYIRYNADKYNIDKTRIILAGTSAGAGTSLWIAANDDLKDLQNSDLVLRESTRVSGVALRETQASYNLEDKWINDVFIDYGVSWNALLIINKDEIFQLYGVFSKAEYETPRIDSYRKTVDMLDLITSDDPEIWEENILIDLKSPTNTDIFNHHAYHVREIKEKTDLMGVANVSYYGKDPIIYSDPSEETYTEFIIRKIKE